jgi:hypothetical protein
MISDVEVVNMNPSSIWSTPTQSPFEIMEILISNQNVNKHEYKIN